MAPALRAVTAFVAAFFGGLVAYLSFGMGMDRLDQPFVGMIMTIHSTLVGFLLWVRSPWIDSDRSRLWRRSFLVALIGTALTIVTGPYGAGFLLLSGRGFISASVAAFSYTAILRHYGVSRTPDHPN